MDTVVYRFKERLTNTGQWRKIVHLKKREIVAGTNCLKTSLYNVLQFLGEKII